MIVALDEAKLYCRDRQTIRTATLKHFIFLLEVRQIKMDLSRTMGCPIQRV